MHSFFAMHFWCIIDTLFSFVCSIDSVWGTSTHARIHDFFVPTSVTDREFPMDMEHNFTLDSLSCGCRAVLYVMLEGGAWEGSSWGGKMSKIE